MMERRNMALLLDRVRLAEGFSLDGVDASVFVGDKSNLEGLPQITIEGWIKISQTGQHQMFVSKFNHGSREPGIPRDDSYSFGAQPDGGLSWQIDTVLQDGTVHDNILTIGPTASPSSEPDESGHVQTIHILNEAVDVTNTQFHYLAGTYDGGPMKVYLDGTEIE